MGHADIAQILMRGASVVLPETADEVVLRQAGLMGDSGQIDGLVVVAIDEPPGTHDALRKVSGRIALDSHTANGIGIEIHRPRPIGNGSGHATAMARAAVASPDSV